MAKFISFIRKVYKYAYQQKDHLVTLTTISIRNKSGQYFWNLFFFFKELTLTRDDSLNMKNFVLPQYIESRRL